ncbi:hypothetical protein AAFF_G00130700 [Aldrovandia affinis]|uniref:FIIND domain-containing protein n=1 Tax=Aldrovandia affinis TaxID=143900 RepID=A0AAD7W992_9TELE|nr:hypothetical protein AAFF_G00130700 [Aldrovandia affinis]
MEEAGQRSPKAVQEKSELVQQLNVHFLNTEEFVKAREINVHGGRGRRQSTCRPTQTKGGRTMVAEMTSFETSNHFEESNGDISPPDQKGNLTENENSSSDNTTSTEESSEDEHSDGEVGENGKEQEKEDSDVGHDQDPVPDASAEEQNQKEAVPWPCCEKCKAIQNHSYESVTPRRISRGRLLALLDGEGTYECAVTGLVFEVSQKAQVRYSILSWSKFGTYLKDSWKFAGPIFDVDCDPSVLKSIQFPHSLCLADQDNGVTFSVLHIKNSLPVFEPSADHTGSHVKWSVTSLSPVGPVVQTSKPSEHHGVVLVYKEVARRPSSSFRVYLATNNHSDIKDIQKEVRTAKKKYVKMEKPPTCRNLLEEKKNYKLISEPEGEINPEVFQFTLAAVKIKGYFEAFFEQPPPFKLSLVEADSEQTVWTATLREGDCEDNPTEKPRKRAESRKRSSSTSEEELISKRARHGDVPGGPVKAMGPTITDQQLMKVAKLMGKEWKQVAICYLGLCMLDIEETKDEDLTMHKFKMLDKWRRRAKGSASAFHLWPAA